MNGIARQRNVVFTRCQDRLLHVMDMFFRRGWG